MTKDRHGATGSVPQTAASAGDASGVETPAPAHPHDLLARFTPIFDEIRAGAVRRELGRELPFDAVRTLADAGFGAVRVPVEYGGSGATIEQLIDLVVALSAADSNVGHLFRGHFGYVELVLLRPESPSRDEWFDRVVAGAVIGNATSEQTGNTLADISTTVEEKDGRWLLNGRKFYSTGTLYSDWIYLAAGRRSGRTGADGSAELDRVTFAVATNAPGVTTVDDWDGFGQRATASGTTIFDDVEVDPTTISTYKDAPLSHIQAFYQLYLVSVLAGIAAEIERDTVEYLRPRTRSYIHANTERPGDDPQVLEVVGKVSSIAFTARTLVLAAARLQDVVVSSNVPGAGVSIDALNTAENATYQAQVQVIERVLESSGLLFEVGGASATFRERALDRHWRNARVVASHNPAIYKYRAIGEYALDGRGPVDYWHRYDEVAPTRFPG